MHRIFPYGPYNPYTGEYRGLHYTNGFLRNELRIYNQPPMYRTIVKYSYGREYVVREVYRNGWIGNDFYKDNVFMYSRNPGGKPTPAPWNNDVVNNSNEHVPTFSNNVQVPIIQAEKPRIDGTKLTNETNSLIKKAAEAQGISIKAMQEQLYARLMTQGNGLDFPKFMNQQQLENRIKEMCNKIIEVNQAKPKPWYEQAWDGITSFGGAVWNGITSIAGAVWNGLEWVLDHRGEILTTIAIIGTAVSIAAVVGGVGFVAYFVYSGTMIAARRQQRLQHLRQVV